MRLTLKKKDFFGMAASRGYKVMKGPRKYLNSTAKILISIEHEKRARFIDILSNLLRLTSRTNLFHDFL